MENYIMQQNQTKQSPNYKDSEHFVQNNIHKHEQLMSLRMEHVVHLLGRRAFVLIDEWLTYGLLLYLLKYEHYNIVMVAIGPAILFNYWGYSSLWKLREAYGVPNT